MQNQLENRVYAGFFVRLVAFAIDSLIIGVTMGIVRFPFVFAPADSFIKANFLFDNSLLDVFGYAGVAAYFVLLTYYAHSTPGKLLMGLEVITEDGNYTFINILYRETVGRFLSSLLCIGYFAVLVTKKHQGFHDMLCDSYVVYKNMMPVPKLEPAVAGMQMSGLEYADSSVYAEARQDTVSPANGEASHDMVSPANGEASQDMEFPANGEASHDMESSGHSGSASDKVDLEQEQNTAADTKPSAPVYYPIQNENAKDPVNDSVHMKGTYDNMNPDSTHLL